MSTPRPFGTWPSPITAQVAASQGLRLSAPVVDGDDIYWLEARPAEGGRNVVVRSAADGVIQEMTPAAFNVRSRVHEYGGGSYTVHRGAVFFSNFTDQRLYRVDRPAPGRALTPVPITPEGRWHYSDAAVDAARGRLICVREDHTVEGRECVNALVAVATDGSGGAGRVLAEGYDFYSTYRAVAGRRGSRRFAGQRASRRRQRHRVDLSAGLVSRRRAAVRERPRGSLAPLFRT